MSRCALRVFFCTFFCFAFFLPTAPAQTPSRQRRPSFSNHYAVVLEEAPVLDRFPTRAQAISAAAQAYRLQVEARQRALRTELEGRGFPVVGAISLSSNAIFVTSTPERVDELRGLPGVTGVIRMRMLHETMDHAVALMNAPAAWTALGGPSNAGKGIKVAVIDTGIDQTHPAFQDPTLAMPPGFPLCTANHPEDCSYTNSKVIVARSYIRQQAAPSDPKNPAADSVPDDFSPRDRLGHGTAVASVIGANLNSGPAASFQGMAPKVYLGNYKVGSEIAGGASEDVSLLAMQDAFADGFDIANFSLGALASTGPLDTGSACGQTGNTPCDFLAFNAEKLVQGGMIIVASAGNDGYSSSQFNYPTYNLISSPANAPSVIAAGGTLNDHVFMPTVSVAGGPTNLLNIAAKTSDAYSSFSNASSAPLVDVATTGDDGTACNPLPAFSLYNAYALILRGTCTFAAKAANAVNAGATGIIFYNSTTATLTYPELQDSQGNQPPLFGPVVMISNSDGVALKTYVAAHPGASVLIDPAGMEYSLDNYNTDFGFSPALAGNQLAGFSSPGPNLGDFGVKPDIVATAGGNPDNFLNSPDPADFYFFGQSGLYVAAERYDPAGEVYSPTGYAATEGTSFSSPMVAGAAALVWQAHPNYTAAQVRAALINSAAQDTTSDDSGYAVNAIQVGAGRLDAGAAVGASVVAAPVSLSFGSLKAGATLPLNKTVTLTNLGSAATNLTIAVSQPSDTSKTAAAGATVASDKSTLALAAGASGTITVTLSGAVPPAGQYAGTVTVTGTGVTIHIPYILLVGTGSIYDMVAVQYGQATYYGCFEGLPNEDVGPVAIKLVDSQGVPVTNSPVQFSVSPRGSVTLQSIGGEPPCTPASSGTATTCNTDAYGIAWAEVVTGSQVGAYPDITARAGGMSFDFGGQQCAQAIIGQPAITGVAEAAVGATNIAPGSYISIYGSNLVNPDNLSNSNGDSASYLPLPLTMDGVNVSFDVPGSYDGKPIDYNGSPAYFTYVGGGQLNVQVPWELQGKSSAQVKVMVDYTGVSNVLTIPLVAYSPQLIQSCGGLCAIDATTYASKPAIVSASNPVHAGDVVELYANGLGPVNNQPNSGEAAGVGATTLTPATVTIGGQNATVLFSGLAPGYPALYQINVMVPSGLAAGSQPVVISIGGQSSKSTNIPIQ